jgi:catechol 2,3-dioxygenase-like lactoylglutathione lyase family enzyme
MELRGVHHVSINVSDLDETLAFYAGTLGLAVLPRPDGEISVPGAWLGCPDGREIHLLVNDVPDGKGQHFAFEVDDVDEIAAALDQAGHPAGQPAVIQGICRQVFCHDPSGNLVEFNQRL